MAGTALWTAIVAGSSVLFSLALACATPFAAIAALAGTKMRPRAALALTGFAWLANQAVGYLVLGYPRTWDSFAWGAAIGLAALLATAAALALRERLRSAVITIACGFVAAFLVYETVLFSASAVLPSGDEAFSLAVVAEILRINVLALAGLLILERLAVATGLLAAAPEGRAAHA
jgi:hypothetical protein